VIDDSLIRAAAVVAAVAFLAAPYWETLARHFAKAAQAAYAERATLGRVAAAGLLIAAAWGQIKLPKLPSAPVPVIDVETPTVEMQKAVSEIASACQGMPAGDRALWAATWQKAAVVVAGDAVTTQAVFTDTRSLQLFSTLSLEIAWRRIGGHVPGSNEPLREAVQSAYSAIVGREVVPVDKAVRERFVEFAKAVAWAGINRG